MIESGTGPDGEPEEDPVDLPPADTIDTGEPLMELQLLGVDPREGFLSRFRNAIGRRLLGAHLAQMLSGTLLAVLEILDFVLQPTGGTRSDKGDN